MTREGAEKKLNENYKSVFAKSINVNDKSYTAYRLNIVELDDGNNYDVVVHLSPNIPDITPMPLEKFLSYPRWNNL